MSGKYIARYSQEFKESAIRLALESDCPASQIANNLGVTPSTLNKWINDSESNVSNLFSDNNSERRRLKKELNRVTLDRDMLKKSAAYFAKASL